MHDDGGPEILLDDEDKHLLTDFVWVIGRNGYAHKRGARKRGVQCLLHRIVMGAEAGVEIHHKNGNKLDCRKENLMLLSPSEHQNYHKHNLIERNRSKRIYPITRVCEHCELEFVVDRNHRGRNRFCSKRCGSRASAPTRMRKRKEGQS